MRTARSPVQIHNSAGDVAATQDSFRLAFALSRVHWVQPELVVEITYLTCTSDGILRHTVHVDAGIDPLLKCAGRHPDREKRKNQQALSRLGLRRARPGIKALNARKNSESDGR